MNLYYVSYTTPIKVAKDQYESSAAFICKDINSALAKATEYGGETNTFEIYAEHKLSKDWSNESED